MSEDENTWRSDDKLFAKERENKKKKKKIVYNVQTENCDKQTKQEKDWGSEQWERREKKFPNQMN